MISRSTRAIAFVSSALLAAFALLLTGCPPERTNSPSSRPRAPLAFDKFVAPASIFEVRWRRHLTEEPLIEYKPQEFAAAAAEGGRVYMGSSAGSLLALERKNGDMVWHAELGGQVASRPRVVTQEGLVYVGAQDGGLYALELASGKQRWAYFAKGPIETNPVYADGLVFFTSGENRVYALDAARGAWKWQYDRESPENFTIRGYGAPLVHDGRVYVGFSDGSLACIKASSGEVLWTRALGGDGGRFTDIDATPMVHDGTMYVSSYATGVYALDPKDGSVKWKFDVEGAGTVRAGKSGVCFSAAKAGIHCLDFAGHLKWRQALSKGGELSPPAIADPYVLVSSSHGGLYIADADRGTLYQYLLPGHGATAEPVADGDQVYVLSNGGYLYALGPARGGRGNTPAPLGSSFGGL